MKCPNCGKEIVNDSVFCEFCGVKLNKVTEMNLATITFKEAISICFHKYATFSGRASRAEYWWFVLFNVIIGIFAFFFDIAIQLFFFTLIEFLVFFLPGLSVWVRRCHDTNHSGWWILCPIYRFILLFLPSDPNSNQYD